MTITAILVTMAFSAYLLFQKQYQFFVRTNEQSIESQQLTNILEFDAFHSQFMRLNQGRLVFQITDKSFRQYQFHPEFIVRSYESDAIIPDTFFFPGRLLDATLNSQLQPEGLIDHCRITLTMFERDNRIILNKRYSASDLLQHEH